MRKLLMTLGILGLAAVARAGMETGYWEGFTETGRFLLDVPFGGDVQYYSARGTDLPMGAAGCITWVDRRKSMGIFEAKDGSGRKGWVCLQVHRNPATGEWEWPTYEVKDDRGRLVAILERAPDAVQPGG